MPSTWDKMNGKSQNLQLSAENSKIINLIVTGETGTGKSQFLQLIAKKYKPEDMYKFEPSSEAYSHTQDIISSTFVHPDMK